MPSTLSGFLPDAGRSHVSRGDGNRYFLHGVVVDDGAECVCRRCSGPLHVNQTRSVSILHVPFADLRVTVRARVVQRRCPSCGATRTQRIPFKHPDHRLAFQLYPYVCLLLGKGLTLKAVSGISGVGRNIVKAVDKERLTRLCTESGRLRKPDRQARAIAVDESRLHIGHRYATHVIDLDTGEVLWISEGKSMDVIDGFIDFVGEDWMRGVEAVACDMNAAFHVAFTRRCPHLKFVFDHFHVIKNFNEKVVAEVRKDEQARLQKEGRRDEARPLKHSRYILTSSRRTLSGEPRAPRKRASAFFEVKHRPARDPGERRRRYEELIAANETLYAVDTVKEFLEQAYRCVTIDGMADVVNEAIDACRANGNGHLARFAEFLASHFEGIVNFAEHRISSGRIEGINNRIKTMRRQSYGFPDTEYFFLKIIDSSRRKPVI